jgi:hypothetical protein
MKISESYASKLFLAASDLAGREFELVIEAVAFEEIQGDGTPEKKPVVRFRAATKGLVLNKTNADCIAAEFGDETNGWLGRSIVLYPTTTLFKGSTVACLRVRIPQLPALPPARQPPAQQPAAVIDQPAGEITNDGIPF